MARIDDLLETALKGLPLKPASGSEREDKKGYSEKISQAIALALADELRKRGLKEARPAPPGVLGGSGAERRMAGGLGAKKVDVTWTTDESGLLLAISIKSINFPNYQKNLTNRRGDMLMEAVTLHRRFPYSVLAAFFFFDKGAESDHTSRRKSTFHNAHARLKLFTGRSDPAGREEQFEKFYIILMEANLTYAELKVYEVGNPSSVISLETVLDDLLLQVAERNPDFYEFDDGKLKAVRN